MGKKIVPHVFISYVREDTGIVLRLSEHLEKSGVEVWIDRKDIKPGVYWKDAIREAITSGSFFLACFSKNYLLRDKSYMNEELTLAIDELRQYPTHRPWFIPVLLSECSISPREIGGGKTIRDLNWLPLYEDWHQGISQILSVINPIKPKVMHLIHALQSDSAPIRRESSKILIDEAEGNAAYFLTEALGDTDHEVGGNLVSALEKHRGHPLKGLSREKTPPHSKKSIFFD